MRRLSDFPIGNCHMWLDRANEQAKKDDLFVPKKFP